MIIKTYDKLRMQLKTRLARSASNATRQYRSINRIEPFQREMSNLFSEYRKVFFSAHTKKAVWRVD